MNSIVYVGMDVHKEQYTLCCYSYEKDKVEYKQTIPSDYKLVLKYMEQVRSRYDGEVTFVCGYEAGCLGYSLYHQLKEFGADRQALDATRVLRVPGSINSKSKTVVSIIDEYDYIYDLREIQKEYLPELKPKEKKKGRPKKVNYVYRERSLYFARIQDITKLCELREYDLRGHREIILFLYRYYLCSFTEDVQKALEDVLELNSMFIYP